MYNENSITTFAPFSERKKTSGVSKIKLSVFKFRAELLNPNIYMHEI